MGDTPTMYRATLVRSPVAGEDITKTPGRKRDAMVVAHTFAEAEAKVEVEISQGHDERNDGSWELVGLYKTHLPVIQ